MVRSANGNTDFFDIVAGVLQRDSFAPFTLITWQDYVLRTSINLMKWNGFTQKTKRQKADDIPQKLLQMLTIGDLAQLTNTPAQAKSQLHSLEQAARNIDLFMNADETEFTTIGKSDLFDDIKREFFQAAAVSACLLYSCTSWKLMRYPVKKPEKNYTRMPFWINPGSRIPPRPAICLHLANHPSRTNKTCLILLVKLRQTHKRHFPFSMSKIRADKSSPYCYHGSCRKRSEDSCFWIHSYPSPRLVTHRVHTFYFSYSRKGSIHAFPRKISAKLT